MQKIIRSRQFRQYIFSLVTAYLVSAVLAPFFHEHPNTLHAGSNSLIPHSHILQEFVQPHHSHDKHDGHEYQYDHSPVSQYHSNHLFDFNIIYITNSSLPAQSKTNTFIAWDKYYSPTIPLRHLPAHIGKNPSRHPEISPHLSYVNLSALDLPPPCTRPAFSMV